MFTQHAQAQEYRLQLHRDSATPAVQTLLRLARMELEDRKVRLLRVGKDEVERLQGEASVWANIIDCIERDTTRVDKPLKPTV
jgi:hypothetical protein